MKTTTIRLALLAALSAMASAQASEFDGSFIGARAGLNRSDISGGPLAAGGKDAATFGIDGGHNWDLQRFLLGVDIFLDSNSKADHAAVPANNYGSDAYGVDLKLGLPQGRWLPYARLGYAHTKGTNGASTISGGGLHGGLGIEYKYTPNWGVNAEWSGSSAKTNGSKLNNDNLTFGVRYYFSAPKAAPAPAPAPQPVAVKEAPKPAPVIAPAPAPAPVAAPAPQPRESWKTVLSEKPVRLEGANFATSSAKLLKTADVKLNEVVNAARQYPEVRLEVSGHTDDRGKRKNNQKLSENRAAAVKAWLVKNGVAADRISTAGYADTQPIADNKTETGRAANRRVEVRYAIKEEKKVRVTE